MAGILNHSLDFACFYAPTVNSYKRLFEEEIQEGWNKVGNNGNIQGVNHVKEDNKSIIHFALPGADSNPYLVINAAIHSALSGIRSKFNSSIVQQDLAKKTLPVNLYQAIKIYNDSAAVKKALGEDFHYHYGCFYTYEYQTYMNQISLWEKERYLYSI